MLLSISKPNRLHIFFVYIKKVLQLFKEKNLFIEKLKETNSNPAKLTAQGNSVFIYIIYQKKSLSDMKHYQRLKMIPLNMYFLKNDCYTVI